MNKRNWSTGSRSSLFLFFTTLTAVAMLSACGKTTSGSIDPSTIVRGLTLVAPPDKTVYAVSEPFDPSGLAVEATYADRSTRPVPLERLAFRGFDSSVRVSRQVVTAVHGGYEVQFEVSIQ